MVEAHLAALEDVLNRIQESDVTTAAAGDLGSDATIVTDKLRQAVLQEVPAFSITRNPDLLPELGRHVDDHVSELLRLLRGGEVGDFEFVRAHARRRAEQRFPLEATLHAYRVGHKVLLRWMREAMQQDGVGAEHAQRIAAIVTDLAMEYTDAISMIFAAAYSAHSLLLANIAGDERLQLLELLLSGHDESDSRATRTLRDAGFLADRLTYCVVLARSVDAAEMHNAPRARRLAESVDQAVDGLGLRRVIDVRDNKVTLVAAAVRRQSGWTTPSASIASRLASALSLLGNAVLVGVGNDAPSTSHVPLSLHEAATALELASVSQRVVQFSTLPLQRLLLHFAGDDFRRVLPAWSAALFEADDGANGSLIATLRAYAAADMNILKAAQSLRVHPNTIYARMQRISDVSGLDARRFSELAELLLVCDCRPESAV